MRITSESLEIILKLITTTGWTILILEYLSFLLSRLECKLREEMDLPVN